MSETINPAMIFNSEAITETEAPSLETVIEELVETVFGDDETITPYKVHNVVNGTFEILGASKRVPPQMMYNYSRNGMLVKGVKGIKALNKEQVTAFVTKYVNKHI